MVIESVHAPSGDQRRALVEMYDAALPQVYGYLAARTGSIAVAEDLTSETFLAAAAAVRHGRVPDLTVAWLIGVARHKLVDHWRRSERESRSLAVIASEPDDVADTWDAELDALTARRVLAGLGPHHRGALTLRYLDGLPVRQVADLLGRTEGATEVLLVRAKAAFRAGYPTDTEEAR
ncbi:MAG TPA: sigma-70 family RNA polymerase sigma factor [Ilumatobacter sp.]|nr:sigma-70 family RNA polymerase sigma factor [Ilumatobacter sp.]